MTVAALVVGAGRGERFRAGAGAAEAEPGPPRPKAFVRLAGRPLLEHAVAALSRCPEIDRILPVVASEAIPHLATWAPGLARIPRVAEPVAGGAERQDSVRAGLAALPADVVWVAVHDAARPCVRPEDVARVVEAACETGAAILAVPVADTVKRVRDGRVAETVERSALWAAQTPQVFRRDWLEEAHAKARAEGVLGTDDASLVEALGLPVAVVPGDPANRKVTTAADLAVLEAAAREPDAGSDGE